jgi:hypothetical protein
MTMKDFVKCLQDTFDERANITLKKLGVDFKDFTGNAYVLTIEVNIDDEKTSID